MSVYCWCFCTSAAFHIRILKDCSEQVCVCARVHSMYLLWNDMKSRPLRPGTGPLSLQLSGISIPDAATAKQLPELQYFVHLAAHSALQTAAESCSTCQPHQLRKHFIPTWCSDLTVRFTITGPSWYFDDLRPRFCPSGWNSMALTQLQYSTRRLSILRQELYMLWLLRGRWTMQHGCLQFKFGTVRKKPSKLRPFSVFKKSRVLPK